MRELLRGVGMWRGALCPQGARILGKETDSMPVPREINALAASSECVK